MDISAPEIDNTHVHLQTMLYRVRSALNECPVDPQLTLRSLRSWLDVCIRYEEEIEAQRLRPVLALDNNHGERRLEQLIAPTPTNADQAR